MREEWFEFDKIGQMYIEKELVVGNEVVLFVCIDCDGKRYLFMTYDSYESEYVISPITNRNLVRMLTNKITMEEAFRNSDVIYKSMDKGNEAIDLETFSSTEFDSEMLPVKGEYYELTPGFLSEYIDELNSEMESGKVFIEIDVDIEATISCFKSVPVCVDYRSDIVDADYYGAAIDRSDNSVLIDYENAVADETEFVVFENFSEFGAVA